MNHDELIARLEAYDALDKAGNVYPPEGLMESTAAALRTLVRERDELCRSLGIQQGAAKMALDQRDELQSRLAEEVAQHDHTREIQTAAQVRVLMLEARLEAATDTLVDARRFIVMACGESSPAVKIMLGRIDAARGEPT